MTDTDQVAHFRKMIATNDRWATRALMRVYANQTADEKTDKSTRHANGVGFNSNDAPLMTGFAQFYQQHGLLTYRQLAVVRRVMPKYARQLARYVAEQNVVVVKNEEAKPEPTADEFEAAIMEAEARDAMPHADFS